MFIPLPLLAVIGVAILALIIRVVRVSRRRDPLQGGQAPTYRAPPRLRQEPEVATITTLPPEVETQVLALLSAGRKIQAIKVVRDATHLGLKDAKDLVESME